MTKDQALSHAGEAAEVLAIALETPGKDSIGQEHAHNGIRVFTVTAKYVPLFQLAMGAAMMGLADEAAEAMQAACNKRSAEIEQA